MAEPVAPNPENLSGVWHGIYSYADGQSVSFVATLVQIGSDLSGTTEEPCLLGGKPGDVMVANLTGRRNESAVQFVKTYRGRNPFYDLPVSYEGGISSDATEIDGHWRIAGSGAGTFLMIRSGGKKARASRKATVRA